jgi:hypothetical protein
MARFEFYDSPERAKAEELRLRYEEAAKRMMLALYRFDALLCKNFNPNQPRVPRGNPDGGQWTDDGGGTRADAGSASLRVGENNDRPRPIPVAIPAGGSRSGVPAKLPNGLRVPDSRSPTGYMMSPVTDLSDVAAAGRNLGETYNRLIRNPEAAPTAFGHLLGGLFSNVGTGGTFDYQRAEGNLITGFTQLRPFRNVSNFNVGLFCQQAGLTLEETLSFAGVYAARFSSNADSSQAYGLDVDTYKYIVEGHKVGQSGVYGPAASSRLPK